MKEPIGIVLAAGKGTRMKSDLPKVLCQAIGQPLIHYVLASLRQAGVGRIIVIVGYRAELVESSLAHYDNIEFALQAVQRGTGHAVMMAEPLVRDHNGPVVVVAGDSPMLQSSSIRALLDEYARRRPACLLGTLEHDNPQGLGRIVRDENGDFVGIVEEKDATVQQRQIREVNMSTYLFDCQAMLGALGRLTDDNQQQEYYITDLPGILLKEGRDVRALPVLQPIEALSVNTEDQLAEVERVMQAMLKPRSAVN
jgi:bifunctional UDP-N-acetylglucosamine pyrophosphorylase/glucosamine-1-phosphate N-acetyltransferase/UDP-N-acetylglucosamine pyrophosphorylase